MALVITPITTVDAITLAGTTDLVGGQIKFPATINASAGVNTLDDYEEGTWTPTVRALTTFTSAAYTIQVGTYTKIGRICYITCHVGLSSTTGATGELIIEGLPFTQEATDRWILATKWVTKTSSATNRKTIAYINWNTNYINQGQNDMTGSGFWFNWFSTDEYIFSGWYITT